MTVARDVSVNQNLGVVTQVNRDTDISTSGAGLTVSTETGDIRRLIAVAFKYSGASTAAVSVTVNSGAGASWDFVLDSQTMGSAPAGSTTYTFTPSIETYLLDDDVIDAVGASEVGQTCAIIIQTQVIK